MRNGKDLLHAFLHDEIKDESELSRREQKELLKEYKRQMKFAAKRKKEIQKENAKTYNKILKLKTQCDMLDEYIKKEEGANG